MGKKKVMVIDDEEDFLQITELNLEDTREYEVLSLVKGDEVVMHLHHFRPDIILLDMLMPSVGGLDVCKMLNEDQLGMKTPIIILSALEKDIDKREAFKFGVVDYLIKPISKDDIIARIEKTLQQIQGE